MSHLRLDPDYAELDDICPWCGDFVLAGHPPSCPFYDLLDAVTLEIEMDEVYREMRATAWTDPEIRESLLTEEEIRYLVRKILERGFPDRGDRSGNAD